MKIVIDYLYGISYYRDKSTIYFASCLDCGLNILELSILSIN